MRSRDVMRVFDAVPVGTKVEIVTTPLNRVMHAATQDERPAAS
jgi:hypothetical protein